MFQTIRLGETVKSVGLERTVVADGCIGRAILLDQSVRVKLISWDRDTSLKVELESQEQAMLLGLSPKNIYYLLVARLSTDQRGNISSDEVTVEYCELSEKSYKEFADIVLAVGSPGNSLILQKSDRGQYSYLQIKPANIEFTQGIAAKVQKLRENPQVIAGFWDWVDKNTSRTVADYLEAKKSQGFQPVGYGQYGAQPINYGQYNAQPNNYSSIYPGNFAPLETGINSANTLPNPGAPLNAIPVAAAFTLKKPVLEPPVSTVASTPQPTVNAPVTREIPVQAATESPVEADSDDLGLPF